MEIFFLLLAAVGIGGFFYILTRMKTLDIDNDGDVDLDDAREVVEEFQEVTEIIAAEVVDFTAMTKAQIEAWAKENLGVDLDRRKTKANMIEEVESQLNQ